MALTRRNNVPTSICLRRNIDGYLHSQPRPVVSLYRAIRMRLRLSQPEFGKLLGISRDAVAYRERVKRMYHAHELLALKEACKLSDKAFVELLRISA